MVKNMKITAIIRKEAQDILKNKIYLLVVFVQVVIIFGAFGLAVASSIASDPTLLDHYGITSNLKVGVSEDINGSQLETDLINQKLNLIYYNNTNVAQNLLGKTYVAIIDLNSSNAHINVKIDNSNVFAPVISNKVYTAINEYQLQVKLGASGLNASEIKKVLNPVNLQVVNLDQNQRVHLAINSPYFVEIMYGFIVPFILLLPFFLASNIITDSVVGERERKTFEVLLMTPITSSMVMFGKIIPILTFSLIQSMLWIFILNLLGVPIYNPILIILILFFVGLGFVGIGILISMFVDSTKEANSAITILLVFATFILFMPLFIKSSYFTPIINYIPTVLMVKITSAPSLNPKILIFILPTVLISLMIFAFTVRYFRHERAIRL